jgi:hypothetical protein
MNDRLPNKIRATTKQEGINRLLQKDFVHKIANKISSKIDRSLGALELKALIHHLGKLNGHTFRLMPIDEAVEKISIGYINLISTKSSSIYDTHEIMKQFMGGGVVSNPDRFLISKDCGPTSLTGIMPSSSVKIDGYNPNNDNSVYQHNNIERSVVSTVKIQPPVENNIIGKWIRKNNIIVPREKSIYTLLDTRYASLDSTFSRYTWNISSQPTDSSNSVTIIHPLQNLVSMQFNQFLIPYSPSGDNIYKKISLLVDDFNMSSVIGHEGRNYHILFDSTVITNKIQCIPPVQDEGIYRFNEPINLVNKLTISFGTPLQPLIFKPSFYPVTITFNAINSTYINFIVPHLVADGETIIIKGFQTVNISTDELKISAINSEEGHIVSVISNQILKITSDISGISNIVNNSPGTTCFITTRRIFIPIRFTYLS